MNPVMNVETTDDNEISLPNRFRGAIWGQVVADAAALGAHWIYDLEELKRLYPDGIEGFETPQDSHYHKGRKSGDQTHYGDAALLMLESVSEVGHFNPTNFGRKFADYFGSPTYRGYLDKPTKFMLENKAKFENLHPDQDFPYQNGSDDEQVVSATRLAPLVVAHFGQSDLLTKVQAATRVCQNNDLAVLFNQAAAILLVELFEGREINLAVETTAEHIRHRGPMGEKIAHLMEEGADRSSKSVTQATLEFGQACGLEATFPAAIQTFVKYSNGFREPILETLQAGGDNAGRAALLGSWLGAAQGMEAVPTEWINKLTARDRIRTQVEMLLSSTDV